jgi:formate/nitrite transporter FocA (FNT family)
MRRLRARPNMLVCLAVWMAISARTLSGKVAVIIGPLAIFVAAGFQHSIANMSLLPTGWSG